MGASPHSSILLRMFAETSEKKSNVRVAFALVCALAVCCSVMYISADGSDEYVHEIVKGVDAGDSVGSTGVLKAGQIYTETPDGRMRLMDYFNNVEKEISDEVANRKSDIASVRAQMARDFAFNAAARAKLKRNMLHKMAQYAKKARDDLNHAMARTQERFAKQAALANRRYKATLRRDKRTNKLIKHDKREAAKNLKLAVDAWQKSTTAAKLKKTNTRIDAVSAQMKEMAKEARANIAALNKKTLADIATEQERATNAVSKFASDDAAHQKSAHTFMEEQVKIAGEEVDAKFGAAYEKLAEDRADAETALAGAVNGLN